MRRGEVVTRDGVRLSTIEAGAADGHPLVMVPGWSQSAALFERQFEALGRVARVIAVDMRGHGLSDKPATGYRIARLARDLHDVVTALGLERPDLLGHSMGVAVIWSWLSALRGRGAAAPARLRRPAGRGAGPHALERRGPRRRRLPAALARRARPVRGRDPGQRRARQHHGAAAADVLSRVSAEDLAWVASENLLFPRRHAMELVDDTAVHDWRSLIATIRHPTLVIGGAASQVPARSQRWIAGQIPGAEVEIIGADEGGSHFAFIENPERFNERVVRFLTA